MQYKGIEKNLTIQNKRQSFLEQQSLWLFKGLKQVTTKLRSR